MNKVVARFTDGRMIKGTNENFSPGVDSFDIHVAGTGPDAESVEIWTKDLKALFFVKDYAGNPAHVERKEFGPELRARGLAIQVTFKDGEILVGTATDYQPGCSGFTVEPADHESNNERCYVVVAATQDVRLI